MTDIPSEDLRVDVFRNAPYSSVDMDSHVRVTHIPTGKTATGADRSQLRAKAKALELLREQLSPMGDPDATDVDAEDLLRRWFHWWRTADNVPSKLPQGLHVATAAYLTVRAVEAGRKVYGPHSL